MKKTKLIFIAIFALGVFSCENEFFGDCLRGNGVIETRVIEFSESSITGISLSPEADLILTDGDGLSISITTHSNVIDAIEADSRIRNGIFEMDIDGCSNVNDIDIVATIPGLDFIGIDGKANVKTDGKYTLHSSEQLLVDISGEGNVELILGDLNTFTFDVDGNGDLDHIDAQVQNFNIKIDGDGDVKAFELASTNCNIEIRGNGNCEVNVIDNLNVNINGEGNVCYLGSPAITQDINGVGEIRSCN